MGESSLPSTSLVVFFTLWTASLVTVGLLFKDSASGAVKIEQPPEVSGSAANEKNRNTDAKSQKSKAGSPTSRDNEIESAEDLDNLLPYKYASLPPIGRWIRLLRLNAGRLNNPEITCELLDARFTNQPFRAGSLGTIETADGVPLEYEALSWCWGVDGRNFGIRVRSVNGTSWLPVSRTLALSLKRLRKPHKDRLLWIDSICINQADHDERNRQVQLMSLIYSKASQVCIWLGEADADSTTAIQLVKELTASEYLGSVPSSAGDKPRWESLLLLMQRPWFSRRWVVQEIALARQATIHCGPDRLAWADFAVAVQLILDTEKAVQAMSNIIRTGSDLADVSSWIQYFSALGASLLVQETGNLSWAHLDDRSLLPSLEHLVSSLSSFQVTEPRDAVYSMLAIAGDSIPYSNHSAESTLTRTPEELIMSAVPELLGGTPFIIDYSRPYADVCEDFITFCAAKTSDPSRALDILCRPWAHAPSPNATIVAHEKLAQHKRLQNRPRLFSRSVSRRSEGELAKYFARAAKVVPSDHWAWLRHTSDLLLGMNQSSTVGDNGEDSSKVSDEEAVELGLPSWVCQVSGAAFALFYHPGKHSRMRMGRKNADSLVGSAAAAQPRYSASRGMKLDPKRVRFQKRTALGHHSLYVWGYILDAVQDIGEPSRSGDIPTSWLKLAGWTDTASDPPESLWRALVANRGRAGGIAPEYYAAALREVVKRSGSHVTVIITSSFTHSEVSPILAEFCRRVQASITNRRLIRTKSGRLGLANPDVQPGDLICVLAGCTVPVALRCGVKKTGLEMHEEGLVDGLQAFKKCLVRLEEAYIRRLRYQAYIKAQGERGDAVITEIRERTLEINKQLRNRTILREEQRGREREMGFDIRIEGRAQEYWASRPYHYGEETRVEDIQSFYTMIGEAYVEGYMEQASRFARANGLPARRFEIR
ncbi:heterokaryon incompatibility protein-domain-containing protein [Immersiella caudata]|uniref:Heterokaryon incompatibility protein-domain-containing protein n=1 Tax=Immersiella caudata TaxID=314043 RepID=A0AA39WE08_9PEZI|nr:heterokaryon incompatibility protein-domain-containing protein [Immersiella caudata]